MATSPNYAWAEPDNSSLVKNGASDIRTLGDAIDTSVWNVGFGQAGKNKIINGDFRINQRAFTSTTTTLTYGFDRWYCQAVDGTTTYSAQTFTLGAAPVAGYEGTNFARLVSTGQTLSSAQSNIRQQIESVRTFAGQTVTVSFWAKASAGTPSVAFTLAQYFGSGGSPSATVNTTLAKTAITSSWVRYSATATLPSISGKTLGTGNNDSLILVLWTSAGSSFDATTNSLGIQSATIDFWGVQVEAGSKMTPFQTAGGGSLQGELAMCQRYYYRQTAGNVGSRFTALSCDSTTVSEGVISFPTQMRIAPTALETSGTVTDYSIRTAGASVVATAVTFLGGNVFSSSVNLSVASGLVAGAAGSLRAVNTNAYLGWSAEL